MATRSFDSGERECFRIWPYGTAMAGRTEPPAGAVTLYPNDRLPLPVFERGFSDAAVAVATNRAGETDHDGAGFGGDLNLDRPPGAGFQSSRTPKKTCGLHPIESRVGEVIAKSKTGFSLAATCGKSPTPSPCACSVPGPQSTGCRPFATRKTGTRKPHHQRHRKSPEESNIAMSNRPSRTLTSRL